MLEKHELTKGLESEELQNFRQEVEHLFKAEENKELTTGHFIDPNDKEAKFKAVDLGLPELKLWTGFKSCLNGERPAGECVDEFRKYKENFNQEETTSLAKSGLISYVGNKLGGLFGREELAKRKESN